MLSQNAIEGVESLFRKSVLSSAASNNTVVISEISAEQSLSDAGSHFVVLTISSSLFKFLTLFHFGKGNSLQEHFLGDETKSSDSESQASFKDRFLEFGNMCAGAMNREMLKYFSNLGMSTPYVLHSPSLAYVPVLNPGYVKHFNIQLSDTASIVSTVCMCAYQPIDFTVSADEVEESTGELEFF
jgi:hypothetical protein